METLDLTKILSGCPKGTPLFSPIFGDVELVRVLGNSDLYPIEVKATPVGSIQPEIKCFTYDGKYWGLYGNDECLLFPSKDCRDWSQFVPPMPEPKPEPEPKPAHNFRPFDRVLVRDSIYDRWDIAFFKEEFKGEIYPYLVMGSICRYKHCLPYEGNESLFNTTETPQG